MKKYLLLGFFVLCAMSVIFYLKRDWVIAHEDLTAGIITSIVLILALIPALNTLAAMRHDRATSLAMSIRETYDSGEILEARAMVHKILNEQENQGVKDQKEKQEHFLSVLKDYCKNHPREFVRLISIPAMFDSIGWLVRKKCCEPKAIDEQLDWNSVYNLWELYVREVQGKKNGESLDDSATAMYGNFVWLVNKLTN